MRALIEKANNEYVYWSSLKYQRCPDGFTPRDLWAAVCASRMNRDQMVWPKYGIHFALTDRMQRMCHEFDMNFGGFWGNDNQVQDAHKERYLISSLMEEAISSSQMEGAATTRKVAKEMLRKKKKPHDRSQQMIHNNYQTIRFIVENKDKALTKELLLEVHRLMTEHTLENEEDAGRIRSNDDVVVENALTHETIHTPPSFKELPAFIEELCTFFNNDEKGPFQHPIIKAITIHFMLAYMHPFVDGNGRTARALFYWHMLKNGYWLTEYLSISRVIYHSKSSYEKAYLYAENADNDIGYFIQYNLNKLQLAVEELQQYIKRKNQEREAAQPLMQLANVNYRQAEIIRLFVNNSQAMITVKDMEIKFSVSHPTIRTDIMQLMEMGVLSEVQLNKVKRGYIKGPRFEEVAQVSEG